MVHRPRFSPLIVAVVLVAASFAVPRTALAATFTVTIATDPLPNGCYVGGCSLREAIIAANGAPGSTVNVPAGTFTLTRTGSPDTASVGDLDITAATTVVGAGASATFVQAHTMFNAAAHRVFDVYSASRTTISKMTIRFGKEATGGCVKNDGALTLDRVTVTRCFASLTGGGISGFEGPLTVVDSTVSDNVARSSINGAQVAGGGIAGGASSQILISRTLVTRNTAENTNLAPAAIAHGGGFSTIANLTISDSTISDNFADAGGGGLGDPRSTMAIQRSTFSGNRATRDGGGLGNDGRLTVSDSTFSGNAAGFNCAGADCLQAYAGGLLNTATATSDIVNSTFTGNSCLLSGGGLLNSRNNATGVSGTMSLYNVTVVDNTCDLGAGVSSNQSAQTHLTNTIIANNHPGAGGDCSGVFTSHGYNLIGSALGCSITGDTTGNLSGVDPKVSDLQDNGGPTLTHALAIDSPAVDAGDPTGCTDAGGATLTTDQRGFLRPSMTECDIGAHELGTSVLLWTKSNTAMAWQIDGSRFVRSSGMGGPGQDWTAQSYWRDPDGSYRVLWSIDNTAALWRLRPAQPKDIFVSSTGLRGPGAGWLATSFFPTADGGFEILWTSDNAAEIWKVNQNGSRGPVVNVAGPGAGWEATSYQRATDGTMRLLWTVANKASLWTFDANGVRNGMVNMGHAPEGWLATSYNLNGDGTYFILWSTTTGLAHLWTINPNDTFKSQLGIGATGWRENAEGSAESYFFSH